MLDYICWSTCVKLIKSHNERLNRNNRVFRGGIAP